MNARQWILACCLCLFVGSWGLGQTPIAAKADNARIDALIRKLGSTAYVQREQARKELEAIGTPALDALRRAAKNADVETAHRIADMIRKLEEQVLTKQILAPKEIHLKVADVTVQQAILELANSSGYPIQFLGDATKFADKKITLATGKTSFWRALDQLCDQAGLMERVDLTPPAPQAMYYYKGGIRHIKRFPAPQPQPAQTGPILLTNRGNEKSLIHFAGAIKTELRISRDATKKDLVLTFIVSAEPHLQNGGVVGRAILDKVLDQHGRKLQEGSDSSRSDPKAPEGPNDWADLSDLMTQPLRRFVQTRIKDSDQAARQIKELTGQLTYQLDLQNETLARVEKVMDATGKSVATTNGGTLKVISVRKQENGILVDVALENTMPNPFGNNVIINGGNIIIRGNVNIRGGMVIGPNGVRMNGGDGSNKDLPDLLDAKGQKYKVANVTADSINFANGSSSRTATIQFQANPGQAEPRALVLFGTRTYTIAVPFRFENVPLP